MTVVVILSVFLLCFLQCYLGETANICQPDSVCIPFADCEVILNEGEVLYPCQRGKNVCCPKLKNTIEITTGRFEPFNTIKTSIYPSDFNNAEDEIGIKNKTNTNYINENAALNLSNYAELRPNGNSQRTERTREEYSVNYNEGGNILPTTNEKPNLNLRGSFKKVNGHSVKTDSCGQNFLCIPIAECDFNFDAGEVLYPCNHHRNVCCPKIINRSNIERTTQKYEPFNTINPNFHQNKIHAYVDRGENVSSNKYTLSEYDNAANNTVNTFNNYNNFIKNESSRQPEVYSLNYNGGNNVLTNDNKEFNFTSSNNATNKLNGGKTDQQAFIKTKETDSKPLARYDSDEIIFNLPDHIEESYNIHSTPANDVNRNQNGQGSKVTKKEIFSEKCGITQATDKITGGKIAEIGQFPWMALLGFKHSAGSSLQFTCGGSLITRRHVLTAAHCIVENHQLELRSIRFGEYNLTTEIDCFQFGKDKVCADHHVDVGVDRVTVHPKFNRKTLKNDIAIIRLKKEVELSDYINTICLPFDKDYSNVNMTGQHFTVSGWGKSNSGDLFGTNVIQYAKVTTWNPIKCNNSLPSEVKPLSTTQLCANGANSEDSCKGDSGGPLINVTLDKDLEVKHIQFGVISFGTGTCGDKNLPTIYTRVDKYLKWILQNVT